MATTITFVLPELEQIGTDLDVIRRKAILAGYTGVKVAWAPGPLYEVTVNEPASKPVIKANLEAVSGVPKLYVDFPFLSIKGCGHATGEIEVRDTRGSVAAGKEVKVVLSPGIFLAVDREIATLDANGKAVFTFGPSPSANMCSASFSVVFEATTDEAIPTSAELQFTRGRRAAQIITAPTDNGWVKYEALRPGIAGNEITIKQYAKPSNPNNRNVPLRVAVNTAPLQVDVHFGTDDNGEAVIPTAQEVADVVMASYAASQHIRAMASGNGGDQVGQQATAINLAGGQDA